MNSVKYKNSRHKAATTLSGWDKEPRKQGLAWMPPRLPPLPCQGARKKTFMEKGLTGDTRRGTCGSPWLLCTAWAWPSARGTLEQRRKAPSSLQCLSGALYWQGFTWCRRPLKDKYLKGEIWFSEQAMKGRLELRSHKLITGTKVFFNIIVRKNEIISEMPLARGLADKMSSQ